MRLHRIVAVLWQEWYVTIHSTEVIVDIFFHPLLSIVLFGFVSQFLSGSDQSQAGKILLQGLLLWQVIWIVQYSVTLGSLWNVWSRNLSNMFVAPMMVREYLAAQLLSGIVKAVAIVVLGGAMAKYLFGFDVLDMGVVPLLLTFVNFVFFGFATGIAVIGVIFRYGTRIQALAWGFIFVFQPLSAAYFPVSVLPPALRWIAYGIPLTLSYEGARHGLLNHHEVAWGMFGLSFAENAVYFALCSLLFAHLFRQSRDTGQFARNEA